MDIGNSNAHSIRDLMVRNESRFIIPRYQREYSWKPELTVGFFNDVKNFTLANNQSDTASTKKPLGVMVMYPNENKDWEVVDGQQRLTAITLLLRAICKVVDETNAPIKNELESCIWLTDELGHIDRLTPRLVPKIENENITDEFKHIIATGTTYSKGGTLYSKNFCWFEKEIKKLNKDMLLKMAARFLKNFQVYLITVESQNEALDWFESLNTKNTPLLPVDIFKAELYKDAYVKGGELEALEFEKRWRLLEKRCKQLLNINNQKKSLIELAFSTYLYKDSSSYKQSGLRKAYSADNYALLKDSKTNTEISAMLDFVQDLRDLNRERFSEKALRLAHILLRTKSAPCLYALTCYFYQKHDTEFNIDNDAFENFLEKVIAYFIGTTCNGVVSGSLANYGRSAINRFVNNPWNTSDNEKFSRLTIENYFNSFQVLKEQNFPAPFLLTWWLYQDTTQPLLPFDTELTIEHIFPKKRAESESLLDIDRIQSLGNIALLEKNVNIRASDYRFADKKKYYRGFTDDKGVLKKGTVNQELLRLADELDDFNEKSIVDRNERILSAILTLLDKYHFLSR